MELTRIKSFHPDQTGPLAVPGKAVSHDHHPLRPSIPLPDQNRAGSKLGPLLVEAGQSGGWSRMPELGPYGSVRGARGGGARSSGTKTIPVFLASHLCDLPST